MPTLLTINATVPGTKSAGSPIFVYYDNGDWEITFAKEISFVERNASYIGFAHVADVLNMLNEHFNLDAEDTEVDEALLFFSETIEEGRAHEPLLLMFDDGDILISVRGNVERAITHNDTFLNFVTLPDLFEDLRLFITRNAAEMFAIDEAFEAEDGDDRPEDFE